MSSRVSIVVFLVVFVGCPSRLLADEVFDNDYFASQGSNVLNTVERYHLRNERFWNAYKSGDYREVLGDLQFILRYFPNHPQALMLTGSVATILKSTSLAVKYYERAITLYPQYAMTHAQYGAYLVGIGQTDDGIAKLKQAIEIDPNLISGHVWLARAYSKTGAHELANRAIEQARALGYKGGTP